MASCSDKITPLSTPRRKLKELDRDSAVYLRHFLHVHNGTSAMIVIYDSDNTVIFINIYKSEPYDTSSTEQTFNQNHAEKFLIADVKEITTQTLSNYQKITKKPLRKAQFRVCIFQSNSPCEPCSRDFIDFKKQIEAKLKLESGMIEFQVGRVWKLWKNKDGLRRLFGEQENGKNPGFSWKEFDWFQFYDAFYEWVLRRTTQTSEKTIQFESMKDIIKHLNDVSISCAIDLISEETHQVHSQIVSLSRAWKYNKCPVCWKSKDVIHCHYCQMDGHTTNVCLKPQNPFLHDGRYRNHFPGGPKPSLAGYRGNGLPLSIRPPNPYQGNGLLQLPRHNVPARRPHLLEVPHWLHGINAEEFCKYWI